MNGKTIADKLVRELLKKDFRVQRYDASSTNSIYIKLDYGLACSIRIADHPGKQRLRYRYNLMLNEDEKKTIQRDGLPMNFYGISFIDDMMEDIQKEKDKKMIRYGGQVYYDSVMLSCKERGGESIGFWQNAKEFYLDRAGKLRSR